MKLDVANDDAQTEVGSYFVANYPPFSVWSEHQVAAARHALDTPCVDENAPPLGLYLHIPFCRKRCRFCYFKVFTDKNARDVDRYLDALVNEIAMYAKRPRFVGRSFEFVYFGGGTPSFLSGDQLAKLVDRIAEHWTWRDAREVTFECEPGTLKKSKLQTIKDIGVTRLSLGIEHFDDSVLELNGRAHKSPEIRRSYAWAREVGFDQINVDLIAGMVGDTQPSWQQTVSETLALQPDSVTIYQMELPHNTIIARDAKVAQQAAPVADWATKRAWVDHAFAQFEQAGYVVSSAYTLVKPSENQGFVYRDSVWRGADMIGTGVASFSHIGGVHYQNLDRWDAYIEALESGDDLPISRALPVTPHQRLVREVVLQLKLGRLDSDYFRKKFDVDLRTTFANAFERIERNDYGAFEDDQFILSRAGLCRVDALLPLFFEPEHRDIRYT